MWSEKKKLSSLNRWSYRSVTGIARCQSVWFMMRCQPPTSKTVEEPKALRTRLGRIWKYEELVHQKMTVPFCLSFFFLSHSVFTVWFFSYNCSETLHSSAPFCVFLSNFVSQIGLLLHEPHFTNSRRTTRTTQYVEAFFDHMPLITFCLLGHSILHFGSL